ncbi:MAG: cytochrome b6-f complex subunit PetL [Xenococcaceae cyanobacterium]
MLAVISYVGIILIFTAIALGLYFGFRAIKLI